MLAAALPDSAFIPAPLWVITALHVVTLTLHFLAMNFLVGGIAVTLFGKIEDKWANPTVRRALKLFPVAMAATVTLGVAPLLFAQLVYGGSIYAASIISGWFWILIPFVAILGYYFLYGVSFAKPGHSKIPAWLLAAFLGLIYISVIYSGTFALAENPGLQKTMYEGAQGGLVFNPDIGSWIFRWLHMITAAVTVGAFFFGWLGKNDEKAFKAAKTFYLYGFVTTSVVGLAYMMTLGDLMRPLMKSSGIWTILFGLIFGLLALLFFFKRKFWTAAVLNLLAVLVMVLTRHTLRLLALADTFDPKTAWTVTPQWDVFVIFLVCFVVAIGVIAWMIRLFVTDRARVRPRTSELAPATTPSARQRVAK